MCSSDLSNAFTTQPHDARFLMIGLTAAGWIERLTGLPDAIVWHGLRLAAAALLVFLAWRLCRTLFATRRDARIAYAFLLFAGGIDWLYPRLYTHLVQGVPSATGWGENPWNYSVFWMGCILTWVLPLLLVLVVVAWAIRDARPLAAKDAPHDALPRDAVPRKAASPDAEPPAISSASPTSPASPRRPLLAPDDRLPLWGGLLFAGTFALHPYTALGLGVLLAVVLAMRAFRRGVPRKAAIARLSRDALLALPGPVLVGTFLLWSSSDPVVDATNRQTALWMAFTPLYLFPIVYGPQVVLAAFGLGRDREGDGERGFAVVQAWAAVGLVLSLNPFIAGTKFQAFFTPALLLLEARGLLRVARWAATRVPGPADVLRRAVLPAVVALCSVNGALGLAWDDRDDASRQANESDASELGALDALRALPAGGVLSDPQTGMKVPWKGSKTVFVGQWFLSTRYYEKADLVRWFFAGPATADQRQGLLRNAGIRYVLHGPREAAMGPVPEVPGLVLAWHDGPWSIWEWSHK